MLSVESPGLFLSVKDHIVRTWTVKPEYLNLVIRNGLYFKVRICFFPLPFSKESSVNKNMSLVIFYLVNVKLKGVFDLFLKRLLTESKPF